MNPLLPALRGLLVTGSALMILTVLQSAEAAKSVAPLADATTAPATKRTVKPAVKQTTPPKAASAPAPTDRGDAHWRHHGVG